MQEDIHPDYKKITISCACGHKYVTMSTADDYSIDVCAACHPFFTGTQKLMDTAGRVEKFQTKFKNWDATKANAAAKAKKAPKAGAEKTAAAGAPAPTPAAPKA